MADAGRARRLGERIQEIVAQTLETRVKDPRLGFVTVTDVRMTPDLHDATVFYTVLGSDDDADATAAALESATGLIRSEVGRRTGVKFTPHVTFVRDALPGSVKAIDDLLAQAQQRDRALREQSASAAPAGEVDPYRQEQ